MKVDFIAQRYNRPSQPDFDTGKNVFEFYGDTERVSDLDPGTVRFWGTEHRGELSGCAGRRRNRSRLERSGGNHRFPAQATFLTRRFAKGPHT